MPDLQEDMLARVSAQREKMRDLLDVCCVLFVCGMQLTVEGCECCVVLSPGLPSDVKHIPM